MIKTTAMIAEELAKYASPKDKLSRMVRDGVYFPIIKGLYETDSSIPGYLIAGSIYGPSYLSFEFALATHGLIPEAVYTFTSATFEKKKKKTHTTDFGSFTYRDIPSEAYPYGIQIRKELGYHYLIAIPEKALCDQLYKSRPVSNYKELESLVLADLRIEQEALRELDRNCIKFLADKYKNNNVRRLCNYLWR